MVKELLALPLDELELEELELEELELELEEELELLEEDDEELELLELEDSVPPPQATRPAVMIPTIMYRNVFIRLTCVFVFCTEAFRDSSERQSRAIVLRMRNANSVTGTTNLFYQNKKLVRQVLTAQRFAVGLTGTDV